MAGSVCCQPFFQLAESTAYDLKLPVSTAAMSAATTVESASAVESSSSTAVEATAATTVKASTVTTVESAATAVEATYAATMEAITAAEAAACAVSKAAPAVKTSSTIETSSTTKAASTAKASSTEVVTVPTATPTSAPASAPSASPAIPWPGADEHSTCEPVRPVVAVRRARIGIIIVVAVRAHRRSIPVARTKSNTNTDLRLRVSQRQHQHTYQSQIFQVTHGDSLFRSGSNCKPPDLQATQMLFQSELPNYLNSKIEEKLQVPQWLISATLLEFNHLRGLRDEGSGCSPPSPIRHAHIMAVRSWPVEPSPRRRFRIIWIPARQQHTSITQPGLD